MISALIAILGGILAASPFIISRKPNAKELLDHMTPYQGWVGVVLAFWGLWGLINAILNIGNIGLVWFIALGVSAVEFVVGFLLGYGLISRYFLERSEVGKVKGQQLRMKLARFQVPCGFILIILGILALVL